MADAEISASKRSCDQPGGCSTWRPGHWVTNAGRSRRYDRLRRPSGQPRKFRGCDSSGRAIRCPPGKRRLAVTRGLARPCLGADGAQRPRAQPRPTSRPGSSWPAGRRPRLRKPAQHRHPHRRWAGRLELVQGPSRAPLPRLASGRRRLNVMELRDRAVFAYLDWCKAEAAAYGNRPPAVLFGPRM